MSAEESIEAFRIETRAWLEANCPPEMREPSRGEGDIVWGGRQQTLTTPQRLWLDHGCARLDDAGLAQRIRRRRPFAG
jgi:hypothetical protein